MRRIDASVTSNYLIIIFALQQGTNFQHPCRTNQTTNVSIFASCPTKNNVTFFSPGRQKRTQIDLHLKSKYLRPLIQRRPVMKAIYLQRCSLIRRQVLVYHIPASIRVRKTPSIKGPRVTE